MTSTQLPIVVDFMQPTREEIEGLKLLCLAVGVRFRGIQPGFQAKQKIVEALLLFDNRFGSTLALPVSTVSAKRIARHTEASESQYRVTQ